MQYVELYANSITINDLKKKLDTTISKYFSNFKVICNTFKFEDHFIIELGVRIFSTNIFEEKDIFLEVKGSFEYPQKLKGNDNISNIVFTLPLPNVLYSHKKKYWIQDNNLVKCPSNIFVRELKNYISRLKKCITKLYRKGHKIVGIRQNKLVYLKELV